MRPATPRFSHKGTGFPWIGNILFWLEGGGRGAGRTQPPTFLAFLAAVVSSCLAVTGGTGPVPGQPGPAELDSSLGALGLGGNRGSLLFSTLHSIKKAEIQCQKLGCVCVGVGEGLRTAVEQGGILISSHCPTNGGPRRCSRAARAQLERQRDLLDSLAAE